MLLLLSFTVNATNYYSVYNNKGDNKQLPFYIEVPAIVRSTTHLKPPKEKPLRFIYKEASPPFDLPTVTLPHGVNKDECVRLTKRLFLSKPSIIQPEKLESLSHWCVFFDKHTSSLSNTLDDDLDDQKDNIFEVQLFHDEQNREQGVFNLLKDRENLPNLTPLDNLAENGINYRLININLSTGIAKYKTDHHESQSYLINCFFCYGACGLKSNDSSMMKAPEAQQMIGRGGSTSSGPVSEL